MLNKLGIDFVEAHATVQSKEVISFKRTRSNRVNMQDVLTPKVFVSYKTEVWRVGWP